MSRRLINMRLDEEFLERVDAAAEAAGQTRTKFVERALEKALGGNHPDPTTGGLHQQPPAPPRAPKGQPRQTGHLPTCRCPVCKPK